MLSQIASKFEHGEDFPTNTPPMLCKLLRVTADIIDKNLPATPKDQLRIINSILCTLAEYLRYAERSRITQTPWSMVQAAERFFAAQTGPNTHFIIRPQWAFNYGIVGEFVEVCRENIKMLTWIPMAEWEQAIGELANKQIYCISFPRLHRLNVLSHANWGHEVGHIVVGRWMATHFEDIWTEEEGEIKSAIDKDVRSSPPPVIELLKDVAIQRAIAQKMTLAMEVARQGIEELACDAIGVHLLGPAALASVSGFCSRYFLDESPVERGQYPPWRYRLRLMMDACAEDLQDHPPEDGSVEGYPSTAIRAYIQSLKSLESIVADSSDRTILSRDVITREVYRMMERRWPKIRADIIGQLPPNSSSPYRLHSRHDQVDSLVAKLAKDLPPNEVGYWPSTAAASLQDILNAAWAFKADREANDVNWGLSVDNHSKLFRLVLKAIESSFVASTFGPRMKP